MGEYEMILLIKLYLIKIMYKIGFLPNNGICQLVGGSMLLNHYFETWDKFSGHSSYPVPHKNMSPVSVYWSNKHKWKGDYGRLRYDLLCHIIKSVKNELKGK